MTTENRRQPKRGEPVVIGFRDGVQAKQTQMNFEALYARDDGQPVGILTNYITTDEKDNDKTVYVLFNWRDVVSLTWDAESDESADKAANPKSHRANMASDSDVTTKPTDTSRPDDATSQLARGFMNGFMTGIAKELATEDGKEALNRLREYAKRVGQVGKGDAE